MINKIEALKKWCLEQNPLNIYEFSHYSIEYTVIILYFYSKILDSQKEYFFYPNESLDYINYKNFKNCYLLTDVLSEIRINNINKILNE